MARAGWTGNQCLRQVLESPLAKSENLSLPNAKIAPTARNNAIQPELALFHFLLEREKASGTQRAVQTRVVVLLEGIQVAPQRPGQQLGLKATSTWGKASRTALLPSAG
jgi:hypothetical protein